jgi:hypothetical protein
VWSARSACLGAPLEGGSCDLPGTDASVQQAHQDALDMVDQYCADFAVDLGFTLTLEMQADIDAFCQQLDESLASGVYGPALVGGAARQTSGDDERCIRAAGLRCTLHPARSVATIAAERVAIVALLAGFHHAVPTHRGRTEHCVLNIGRPTEAVTALRYRRGSQARGNSSR